MDNFIELCQVTKSPDFHGDLMPYYALISAIGTAVQALDDLDKAKKCLFYGKVYKPDNLNTAFKNSAYAVRDWKLKKTGEAISEQNAADMIHAALGMATEAGEALDAVAKAMHNKEFDAVNFTEEIFDTQWYHAIACGALGITFDEGQARIIAKLKKRFGDKFTAHAAQNRDLDAERAVLESTDFQDTIPIGDGDSLQDDSPKTAKEEASGNGGGLDL